MRIGFHGCLIGAALLVPVAGAAADSEACGFPDQEVRLLEAVEPPYPFSAALFCIEGRATFEFTIGTDGKPYGISVVSSEPDGVFDEAGQIIRSWTFEPRCRDGEPVERTATQEIEFNLAWIDAGHCPENLPEDLLEALITLATLQSEVARLIGSGAAPPELLSIESTLEPPYADIERVYRRYLNERIELERAWRRVPWQRIRDLVHPARLAGESGISAASGQLDRLIRTRSRLREQWPEIATAFREEMTALKDTPGLTPLARRLLIGNPLDELPGNLPTDSDIVEVESELYGKYRALIEWLAERTQDWTVEGGELHFASDALAAEHARRRVEIEQLESRWVTEIGLPQRIFWSGL